ncbi:MAG: hypothetical protein ACI4D8_01855, partial [Wujia sp.]
YDVSMISSYTKYESDTNMVSSRNSTLNSLNTVQKQINDSKSNFTQVQNGYLEVLEKGMTYDEFIFNYKIETKEEHETEISVSYAVKGAVIGFMLVCVWVFLKHIVGDKLQSVSELSDCYDIRLIGSVLTNDKKQKNYDEEKVWKRIATSVRLIVEKKEIDSVVIVSSIRNNSIVEYADRLKKELSQEEIKVDISAHFLDGIDDLDLAVKSGNLILLEAVDQSKNNDIVKEIKIAKNYEIDIIGAVVIDD